MKIWWQSAHDFDSDPGAKPYLDRLISTLQNAAAPGNEVVVHGMFGSNPTQLEASKWGHELHAGQIPKLAMQAQREGYDAFCLGCTTDMGLIFAKEAVDIVVCGLSEINMHMAVILGERFAYLTADERGARRIRHLAEEYGLGDRMVPSTPLSMPFSERYAAFDDPTNLVRKLEPIAQEAAKNGAGVLLLSDNVLNMALWGHGISEIAGLTLQEGSTVLVKTTEMMLELQKIGIKRSPVAFPRIKVADAAWYDMACYADVSWKAYRI